MWIKENLYFNNSIKWKYRNVGFLRLLIQEDKHSKREERYQSLLRILNDQVSISKYFSYKCAIEEEFKVLFSCSDPDPPHVSLEMNGLKVKRS